MIKILIIVYIISFYLSLPGFFSKAGYNSLSGLIPIYNLYILFQILEINPIILIIISLGLIFSPDRAYFGTLLFIFIPFMLADAYDKGKVIGLLCFLFPFIFYPLLAYFTGTYRYDMED